MLQELSSEAPISFAAAMLAGLRSASIFSNTSLARGSTSSTRDQLSELEGSPVGKASRGWTRPASTKTHLLLKPSILFPGFEMAMELPYGTKLAHAETEPREGRR